MKQMIISMLLILLILFGAAGCGAKEDIVADIEQTAGTSAPVIASEPADKAEIDAEIPGNPQPEEAGEDEPVNHDWEFDTPENHGARSDMLEKFHQALSEAGIRSAVTVKDGYIIDEYYGADYNEESVFGFASCTKSFSGALIGIAIDQGVISGVDAKLTKFFPQLAEPAQEDKREITIEHLLTHTSGIYWNEWAGGDYFMRFSRSENWVDFVFSQHMASPPGTVFNYTTGGSHLLGAVIQEAAGITEYEFGQKYLFKPLGMDSVKWRSDPQGITDGGNGISMTARDAAKFGQLYLDGGKWRGRQIIPEEWVERSIRRQAAGSSGTGEYGYSWWLRSFGGYEGYYAMGHGGQYIIVVPELNLVTVMTSRLSNTYTPQYLFIEYAIPAFEQGAI